MMTQTNSSVLCQHVDERDNFDRQDVIGATMIVTIDVYDFMIVILKPCSMKSLSSKSPHTRQTDLRNPYICANILSVYGEV